MLFSLREYANNQQKQTAAREETEQSESDLNPAHPPVRAPHPVRPTCRKCLRKLIISPINQFQLSCPRCCRSCGTHWGSDLLRGVLTSSNANDQERVAAAAALARENKQQFAHAQPRPSISPQEPSSARPPCNPRRTLNLCENYDGDAMRDLLVSYAEQWKQTQLTGRHGQWEAKINSEFALIPARQRVQQLLNFLPKQVCLQESLPFLQRSAESVHGNLAVAYFKINPSGDLHLVMGNLPKTFIPLLMVRPLADVECELVVNEQKHPHGSSGTLLFSQLLPTQLSQLHQVLGASHTEPDDVFRRNVADTVKQQNEQASLAMNRSFAENPPRAPLTLVDWVVRHAHILAASTPPDSTPPPKLAHQQLNPAFANRVMEAIHQALPEVWTSETKLQLTCSRQKGRMQPNPFEEAPLDQAVIHMVFIPTHDVRTPNYAFEQDCEAATQVCA